ncbi:MAG: penicillin-binding protein 2 [Actinobacteria bacterium]|nr:penicillin-binding protein 2 [Actinomycetota bacterium]MCA1722005.1 penicillin-binding protein 2 [Actinomycetota bacterium]
MNKPLRRVAVACLLLFGLLLLNVNYVQAVKADDYRKDTRNSRALLRTFDHERGAIVLSGAAPVAVDKGTPKEQFKFLRTYPNGRLYATVTGFSSFVYGQTGVERAQNAVLSGESDQLLVRRLSDYVTGRKPEGGRVVLTLQQAAQRAAYEGLAGKRGAAVALDPRTGAVLAMVSTPTYDPNKLSSHDSKAIHDYYEGLQKDTGDPLLNRVVQQTYPPGSTFKVITSAAALSEGKVTPDTRIPSPRELDLPQTDRDLKNFGGESCGDGTTSTLADAFRISCNTAFGRLGLDLGGDKLREQAQKFGFGETDLEVPGKVAKSVFPDELTPPQQAQSAIGQYDVRVTPLQMAMVAAGVANGGNVMRPYLVREVQGPDLSRLSATEPSVYKENAVSREVADQLTAMMELVVSSGTGTSAQIPGVRVAGKTGTAQHAVGEDPHAWFIGFAPAEDPQVAVAVVVEDGGSAGSEATGGRVAAPIARAMMRAILGS